jgi:hypothetical protein
MQFEIAGAIMEVVKVKSRSPTEIVFSNKEDMMKFHDEITDGKSVVFDYDVDKVSKKKRAEVVNPIIKSDISDNKIIIRSEEDV